MKTIPLPNKTLASAIAIAVPTSFISFASLAQDQEEGRVLEKVIVTGSRRSESLQDVPINISAVGPGVIDDLRLTDISKISRYVPGLTVIDRGPRDEEADIFVRGLNTSGLGPGFSSDTVAVYMGDIPLQADFNPVDLERVEVLIGPQGTLYGLGTMGGAIRYIPVNADLNDVSVSLRGDFSSMKESGGIGYDTGVTLNLPLVGDVLALRANIDWLDDPGFIDYNYVVREAGVSNPEPDFNSPSDVAANLRQIEDANGEENLSARLNLHWMPFDRVDTNFWYFLEDTKAEGRQLTSQLAFNTGPYESAMRYEEPNDYKYELFSADVKVDFGFAEGSFVYGRTEYEEVGQRDQTDLLLNFEYGYEFFPTFSSFTREEEDRESDTFEARLTSTTTGPLQWTAGYFINEETEDGASLEFTPGFDQFAVDNFGGVQLRPDSLEYIGISTSETKEQALYGEISYDITDQFTMTVGARYYEYDIDSTSGFGLPLLETVFFGESPTEIMAFVDLGTNKGKDDGTLFKVNLAYDVNPNNLLYFTYSEGYRNGGVNSVPECTPEQLASTDQQLCAQADEVLISPDTIDNYEIGYKGQLLDNKLSLNAALYYIEWEDLQVDTTTALGSLPITGNGSSAESKGLELNGRWLLTDQLEMQFTYAYTNAELTDDAPGLVGPFSAESGARLPGHAEHQGSINFIYSTGFLAGELDLTYGIVYFSDVYNGVGGPEDPLYDDTGAPADRGLEAIPSFDLHHLSATYRMDSWSVQAFVDNLFDEYYITGTRTSRRFLQNEQAGPGLQVNGFTLRQYGQYVGDPRSMGLRFTYDF